MSFGRVAASRPGGTGQYVRAIDAPPDGRHPTERAVKRESFAESSRIADRCPGPSRGTNPYGWRVGASRRHFCAECFVVLDNPNRLFCPDCAAERRKLRWQYKRKNTPARQKRYRPNNKPKPVTP